MNEKRKEWIEKSYALVAEQGMESLSINSISRLVGKSKSSFYHYFGDLEVFETDLLDYHIQQINIFSAKLGEVETIYPTMIDLFLEYQLDIFFHKQLRIHRTDPTYKKYIDKAFGILEKSVIEQWTTHFDLDHQKIFSQKFFRFISEHFLLSITLKDYSFEYLENYLKEIASLIQHMKAV